MPSRTASETWSQTLSGWPSVTDSDVSRNEREEPKEVATTVRDHIGPREPARGARALPVRHRYVGSNTMKWLAVLALVFLQACDAPWAGPSLPDGGRWVSFTTVSYEGPVVDSAGILAATSTFELEASVITFE